jgi:quercetin dioxygenase-like cupin family protein/uncharacterized protein (DUF2249 family)
MRVKTRSAEVLQVEAMKERPLIETGTGTILSLAQETQSAPNGIVSRTVFQSGRHRVVLFGFAEGQELSEHASTSHALVQILTGTCEWMLDGEPRTLHAGDLLYMPPNLRHAVKATEPFSMLLTLLPPEQTAATPALSQPAVVDVDARGLEPPEPLVKILEAVAQLPRGGQIKAHTDRCPLHLFPQLEVRGFRGVTEEESDGSFTTTIRAA